MKPSTWHGISAVFWVLAALTLVVLSFGAGNGFGRSDPPACREDEVVVWSAETNSHSVCVRPNEFNRWVWVDPQHCSPRGAGLLCEVDPLAGP